MPPTYLDRLRVEGLTLAGCGLADAILLLALSSQARRWPLNTLGQLAVVVVVVAMFGPRSVRKALDRSVEVAPDAVGSGEPTPLWQLPLIVAGLTLLVGLPSAGGWDAGVRIGGGCMIVGLGQAVLMGRLVERAEREQGRRHYRIPGSRILRGTKLGWTPAD